MVAAAIVVGAGAGVYASGKASSAATEGADAAAAASLKAAEKADALNAQRFGLAQDYTTPYLERELQSSNQLLVEMGLQPYQGSVGGRETGGGVYSVPEENQRKADILTRQIAKQRGGRWALAEGERDAKKQQLRDLATVYTPRFENIQPTIQPTAPQEGIEGEYIPAGTEAPAYQQTPAYQRLREEGLSAVNQAAVNSGILYSGRRGEAAAEVGAGVESQFYTNYLNMLQNLANPQVSQNIGALGVGQGLSIGSQNIAAQNTASGYQLQGVAAGNAATADIYGGISSLASAYIGRPQAPQQPPQQPPI